jgi:acyl dehydratase
MTTTASVWPTGAPKVGQRARRTRLVCERDIALFTEISGDRNPIHYDAELAARSRFGGIVVQGGITSALLNALVAEDLPGPGTVFLELNLHFLAPVRPGDTITAEAEVTGVRTDKPITELAVTVARDDDARALEGAAVCYTMLLVE